MTTAQRRQFDVLIARDRVLAAQAAERVRDIEAKREALSREGEALLVKVRPDLAYLFPKAAPAS